MNDNGDLAITAVQRPKTGYISHPASDYLVELVGDYYHEPIDLSIYYESLELVTQEKEKINWQKEGF